MSWGVGDSQQARIHDANMRNLDRQLQRELANLDRTDTRDQLALDRELGLGELDLNRTLGEGRLQLDRDQLGLDQLLGQGQLDLSRDRLGMERDLGEGRLDIDQQQLGLSRDRFGLEQQQFEQDIALRNQLLGFLGLGGGGSGAPGLGTQAFVDGPGDPGVPPLGGQPGQVVQHSGGLGAGNQFFDQGRQALLDAEAANLASLEGYGDSQRARLDRDQLAAQNSAAARMEARGLGSSNLVSSAQANIADEYNLSRMSLEDQLLGRQMDIVGDTAEGVAGLYGGQGTAQVDIIRSLLGQL